MINDSIIEGVTRIANVELQKNHPDAKLNKWQTEYAIKAYLKLLDKFEESDGGSN